MRMLRRVVIAISLLLSPAVSSAAERFPAPDFRGGYQMPPTEVSPLASPVRQYVDLAVLVATLSLAVWLVYRKRSRTGVFLLMVFCLIYFGFYRKGCICPIGSIGNVAYSAGDNGYALPWIVGLFFVLPLLLCLFYGRVFCAGVCPLGAIQDAMLVRPVHLPAWAEHTFGLFAYIYLGLAVMYAALGTDLIICRYDPFVGFFRMSAPAHMLFLGGAFLATCLFIGRVYCRFFCPYGVLLRILSPFSKQRVSITPKDCVDCRLCEQACPFGAIRYPTPRLRPGRKDTAKTQLTLALLVFPVLVAAFAWAGHTGRTVLAHADFTVRLAQRVWQEEHGTVQDVTDQSRAFYGSGQPVEQLYTRATAIRRRFAVASTLLGAWVGLVIGSKLIAMVIRRQRTGYTADPGGCVACGRCYLSCPVEHERRQHVELVVA